MRPRASLIDSGYRQALRQLDEILSYMQFLTHCIEILAHFNNLAANSSNFFFYINRLKIKLKIKQAELLPNKGIFTKYSGTFVYRNVFN